MSGIGPLLEIWPFFTYGVLTEEPPIKRRSSSLELTLKARFSHIHGPPALWSVFDIKLSKDGKSCHLLSHRPAVVRGDWLFGYFIGVKSIDPCTNSHSLTLM